MIDKRTTRSGEARYEVRVRGTDGKERSRTFRTKKEAERHERAQHAAIDSGLWIDPRAGRVTLAAWAREWQRTVVHLRPKTRKIYDVNLRNHILPTLGDYELAKLTPSMLRAWLSDVTAEKVRGKKPIAAGTVAQDLPNAQSRAGRRCGRRAHRSKSTSGSQASPCRSPADAVPHAR